MSRSFSSTRCKLVVWRYELVIDWSNIVETGRKLVVWRYELVIDWSNIITEWSKPGRKELRVGRDHIRTGV